MMPLPPRTLALVGLALAGPTLLQMFGPQVNAFAGATTGSSSGATIVQHYVTLAQKAALAVLDPGVMGTSLLTGSGIADGDSSAFSRYLALKRSSASPTREELSSIFDAFINAVKAGYDVEPGLETTAAYENEHYKLYNHDNPSFLQGNSDPGNAVISTLEGASGGQVSHDADWSNLATASDSDLTALGAATKAAMVVRNQLALGSGFADDDASPDLSTYWSTLNDLALEMDNQGDLVGGNPYLQLGQIGDAAKYALDTTVSTVGNAAGSLSLKALGLLADVALSGPGLVVIVGFLAWRHFR